MNRNSLRALTALSIGTSLALAAAGCATTSPYATVPIGPVTLTDEFGYTAK